LREDPLGNVVHVFSADGPLDLVTIRVVGEVETADMDGVVQGTVERVPDVFYLRDSDLALADSAIREFAADTAGAVGNDPLGALHRLLAAVHREVAYDVRPTVVTTAAAEAFALRKGVCQDLSHIFIAAARHLGLPARYVSGYFRRGDAVTEQEAGHAWAEAKVEGLGWVGFDPANGISVSDAHVRVAVGLDYLGAAPIRGSRTGGGGEVLDVHLTVEAMEGLGGSRKQNQS
jgi:transglutaminase-like putative cysteine protease